MATQAHTPKRTQETSAIPVESLLSPPETKRIDSFSFSSQGSSSNMSPPVMGPRLAAVRNSGIPSPPISPYSTSKDTIGAEDVTMVDPPLFDDAQEGRAGVPLFEQQQADRDVAQDHAIERHMSQGPLPNNVPRPSKEEYALVATSLHKVFFTSRLDELMKRDPDAYVKQNTEHMDYYFGAMRKGKADKNGKAPAKATSTYRALKPAPAGVSKAGASTSKINVKSTPRAPRTPRQKKTPVQRALSSFDAAEESAATPVRATTPKPKTPRATSTRDDVDFNSIIDLCPPLSTLPPGNKHMKTDWRGPGLDFTNDPNRHLLHESELVLASMLRLPCATYLCSKRRIFKKRLFCLQNNKEFRKTDAQQACKIDVNKASKLWSAYEKVGWLDQKYMEPYRYTIKIEEEKK